MSDKYEWAEEPTYGGRPGFLTLEQVCNATVQIDKILCAGREHDLTAAIAEARAQWPPTHEHAEYVLALVSEAIGVPPENIDDAVKWALGWPAVALRVIERLAADCDQEGMDL